MQKLARNLCIAATLALPAFAFAHSVEQNKEASVSLSATATATFPGDVVKVRLTSVDVGYNLAESYAKVNSDLKSAEALLKGLNYSLETISSMQPGEKASDSKGPIWQVQASVVLTVTDIATLGNLVQSLSPYLNVTGYETTLSHQKKDRVEGQLMKDSTANFQQKAKALSKNMGYKHYELRDLHYNFNLGSDRGPRHMSMARDAAVSSSGPLHFEAMSNVTANSTVSGRIVLLK